MDHYFIIGTAIYVSIYFFRKYNRRRKALNKFKSNISLYCKRNNISNFLPKEELHIRLRELADINNISTLRDKIIAKELLKEEIDLDNINSLFENE